MPYVATVNIPGYLPQNDEPPVYDTIVEAWVGHADDRENDEAESACTYGTCGKAVQMLRSMDRCGSVHLHSPRPDDDGSREAWRHDLGLSYSVDYVAEWPAAD